MSVDKNIAALAGMFGIFRKEDRAAHQKQERKTMNISQASPQAPVSGAVSGHSASNDSSDLMSLATHRDSTLTLKSSAHTEELVINPATPSNTH